MTTFFQQFLLPFSDVEPSFVDFLVGIAAIWVLFLQATAFLLYLLAPDIAEERMGPLTISNVLTGALPIAILALHALHLL